MVKILSALLVKFITNLIKQKIFKVMLKLYPDNLTAKNKTGNTYCIKKTLGISIKSKNCIFNLRTMPKKCILMIACPVSRFMFLLAMQF